MRRWLPPVLAGLLALALVATSVAAVVQYRSARDAAARAEDAEARAADLQARVDDLEQQLDEAQAEAGANGSSDPLDRLFGGEGSGTEDLLGDLLGRAGDVPGAECLLPGGADGLEDLLGGEAPDPDQLQGMLEGLLGGGAGDVPDDPDALVDQTADQVAELRELRWDEDVEVEFLDDRAMRDRLNELFDEEYGVEEADLEGRVLTALGAIPRGSDVRDLRRQMFEEQVAGFYDPDTGELVVRTPRDGIGPADRVILAHELDHALTDQALGLPDLEAQRFATDDDALLAAQALVEGDASLLMNQWALGNLGLSEQLAMATDPSLLAAQSALDEVPPHLASELLFPYTAGLEHACERWLDGGWAGVDAGYEELPATTATVLWPDHPGRTGDPAALAAPTGYQQEHATTFGAAQLLWLLQVPGGDEAAAVNAAEDRARAWGGGRLTLWTDGDGAAVGLSLTDSGRAAATLCDTVTAWYAAAFPAADRQPAERATTFDGQAQDAVVACDGDDVRLGIAPDLPTATAVVAPG